jgi:hypothetical protein
MLSVTITKFGDGSHEVPATAGGNAPVVNGSLVVKGGASPTSGNPHGETWLIISGSDVPAGHVTFTVDPKTGTWSAQIDNLNGYIGSTATARASATNDSSEKANVGVPMVHLVNAS